MRKGQIRLGLIGPVPPPLGGMSLQTSQLEGLLRKEGMEVRTIPVNLPFPKYLYFIDKLRYIRAVIRLFVYMVALIRTMKMVDLIHILSNSYLNFFLYTMPAVVVARFYRRKIIINYRGGQAGGFFQRYGWATFWILNKADALIVPSEFLVEVFHKHSYDATVVPNIVNLDQFYNDEMLTPNNNSINLLVARNLEKIYNLPCAIRAFRHIKKEFSEAELTLLGEGSEKDNLKRLVFDLGLKGVIFGGRVKNENLPSIYRKATIVLNPANADNLPISVLEAYASGIPVISTNVGGIPYLIKDGITGLLVNKNDDKGMAQAILRLLRDKDLYRKLSKNGQKESQKYSWEYVRPKLFDVYKKLLDRKETSI